ncbi:MAG: hypothetical protein FWD82_06215 [Defluviitaleaceae bacterium]|nr:hypothetical protein [Defluviitaleaceae bacterium]
MDSTTIQTQAIKFNRARKNLLAVVAFTLVNLFLISFEIELNFLFSAFVPQLLQIIFIDFSVSIALVVGLLSTSIYLLCYFLSKRWRPFMLIALIFFLIDALIMLGFMLLTGIYAEFLLNVVFHIWILFYLVTGTSAMIKLSKVTPENFKAAQQEMVQNMQAQELNSALNTVSPIMVSDTLPSNAEDLTTNYILDDYLKSSIRSFFNHAENFYLFEDIPYQKLENAKNSYAQTMSSEESVIFLYDDTIKGSANEGFLLTTKYLYSKNFGMQGNAAYIQNINDMVVPKFGRVSTHITLKLATRSDIEIHVTKPKAKAEAVFNMLNKTIVLLRSQARHV